MMNFIKNFFSIDEQKISTILIILLALTGTGIYIAITKTNDIPSNLCDCITWISAALLGVNGLQSIRNTTQSSTSTQDSTTTTTNSNNTNN